MLVHLSIFFHLPAFFVALSLKRIISYLTLKSFKKQVTNIGNVKTICIRRLMHIQYTEWVFAAPGLCGIASKYIMFNHNKGTCKAV